MRAMRSAEHRRRKQPLVVRPDQHPRHMRRNKADKADRPADGHAHADEHGNHNEQYELGPLHVHADLPGVVLPNGKGVEDLRVQQDDRAADQKRACQHGGILICAAAQGTHRPERDALDLVGSEGNDDAHNAGDEHGEDHADQDDRVRRQRTVELIGKAENDKQR